MGDDAEAVLRQLEEEKSAYENCGKITGGGSSQSTVKKRSAAVDKYNAFAKDVGLVSWDDTPAEDFCQEERLQKFAHWLVNVYTKQAQKDKDAEALRKNTVIGQCPLSPFYQTFRCDDIFIIYLWRHNHYLLHMN